MPGCLWRRNHASRNLRKHAGWKYMKEAKTVTWNIWREEEDKWRRRSYQYMWNEISILSILKIHRSLSVILKVETCAEAALWWSRIVEMCGGSFLIFQAVQEGYLLLLLDMHYWSIVLYSSWCLWCDISCIAWRLYCSAYLYVSCSSPTLCGDCGAPFAIVFNVIPFPLTVDRAMMYTWKALLHCDGEILLEVSVFNVYEMAEEGWYLQLREAWREAEGKC